MSRHLTTKGNPLPHFGIAIAFGLILLGCWDGTIIGTEYRSDTAAVPADTSSESDSYIDSAPDSDSSTDTVCCEVPTSFSWTSSAPLIYPPSDANAIKDPTVLFSDGKWHIYATTGYDNGLSITYLSFADWSQASAAEKIPISTNDNITGYTSTPQLFYFAPQELWYLVYQTQEPAYSTSTDPSDVSSWSAPTQFMAMPALLTDNDYAGFDYWVICNDTECFLFFTALNGILYRARTPKEDFPNGFEGTTEIVMEGEQYDVYDACNVYKMEGTNQYLLLVSALGSSGVWRYSRAWVSDTLDGNWTPLADTETTPFASSLNTVGADWSKFGISHGEMLRTNPDETMTINTGDMQFLYSGLFGDTDAGTEYYCLALLTAQ